MFGGGFGSMFIVPLLIGAVMTFLRAWMFYAGTSAIRGSRISRSFDDGAHLSFDERIAERMRELEREKDNDAATASPIVAPPSSGPTGVTGGFGRRQA